ncbi:MAG: LacI family DNA-binding transcriptional regulator [Afipia felis]|nr:LacI family DNA-binding transcriptional regulator [Afipia felis]
MSTEKSNITLDDVAAKAGVSPITVSRTLRKPNLVAEKTRKQVELAISKLGYVPDLIAGSLASRQTRQIAVVIPSLNTPAFMRMVRGISEYLSPRGYQFVLGDNNLSGDDETKLIASLLGRRSDGIILADIVQTPEARKILERSGVPVVETWSLTRRPVDMNVGFNNQAAAREAVRHLVDIGRRRIGMICGPLRANERGRQRALGFRRAMEEANLNADLFIELPLPISFSDTSIALRTLYERDKELDAVFCSGDSFAVGALFEAQRQGRAVPDDLAIVGLGDLDLASYVVPALTRAEVPGYEMGRLAAEMIVNRLSGNTISKKVIDVGFKLVVKGSTVKPA